MEVFNPFNLPLHPLHLFSDSITVNSTPEDFELYLKNYLKLDERLHLLYESNFNEETYNYSDVTTEHRRTIFVCIALYEVLYRTGTTELMSLLFRLHPRVLNLVVVPKFRFELHRIDRWKYVPLESITDHKRVMKGLEEWVREQRTDLFCLLLEIYTRDEFMSLLPNKTRRIIGERADAELIDTLIKYNYEFSWIELHAAAKKSNVYVVRKMLEMGVLQNGKPEYWDYLGRFSPSFEGFISYNIEIMRLFMAYGGNPREIDDGMNIITIFLIRGATQEETKECLIELLGYGVDVSTPDEDGDYSLHIALRYGVSQEIIALLIKSGADVNHKDDNGCSSLHYARGDEEMTKYLVSLGAK